MNSKLFKHFTTLEIFNSKKISAISDNTAYYNNDIMVVGEPEIAWNDICFIEDEKLIWTHGEFYGSDDDIVESLSNKVDKITGKGLSTEDFTTAYLAKLNSIEEGAQVNVRSDWNEANTLSYAYILNKPTIPPEVTEAIVAGWGFTKNDGTITSESDPTVPAHVKAITANDIVNWNGKTNNVGTITGINMNGVSKGTSGVVDLGTVITEHQSLENYVTKTQLSAQSYLTSHQSLSGLASKVEYNSTDKKIYLYDKDDVKLSTYVDTSSFIKDGMVNEVKLDYATVNENSVMCLVVTFNTDAGKEDINIPLSDIFDASNYYDIADADELFVTHTQLSNQSYVTTSALINQSYVTTSTLSNQGYLTTHQNIKTINSNSLIGTGNISIQENVKADWNITDSSSQAYILNKPTIPPEVTEAIVAGWGFTKNDGTITSESDPTVPAHVKAITANDIVNWNGKTNNVGTITGINMNGVSKGTSGVVDLGTVITEHQSLEDYVTKTQLSNQSYVTTSALSNQSYVTKTQLSNQSYVTTSVLSNQGYLTAHQNIKTINNNSLVGTGDITIQENVKGDWNEDDSASNSYILNKPNLYTIRYLYSDGTKNLDTIKHLINDCDRKNWSIVMDGDYFIEQKGGSFGNNTGFERIINFGIYENSSIIDIYVYTIHNKEANNSIPNDNWVITKYNVERITKANLNSLTSINYTYGDSKKLAFSTDIPSITGLATETYVTNKIADLVNSAPTTLDTLNELATALGNDPNFATTVSTQIGEKVSKTELSNQSYVTTSALSNQSYVTSTALSNQSYVTTSALSAQSYINQTTLNNASYAGYSYIYAAYAYIMNSIVDNELVMSTTLDNLFDQIENNVTKTELSAQSYAGYSYVYDAYSYILNTIIDNELITSIALTDHNNRLEALESSDLSDYAGYSYVYDAYSYLINSILDNELVVTTALDNIYNQVDNISGQIEYLEGIQSDWNESDYTSNSYILNKPKGNAKIFYGTCSTAAGTVNKKVVCDSFTLEDLVKGALIFVTFDNTNSGAVASLTLDVNSTGAKHIIKLYNTTLNPDLTSAGELKANKTYLFGYDGTYWVCLTLDYNSTGSSMTDAEYQAGTGTSARTITPARLKAAITYWMAKNQADWNETNETLPSYILNKPTIPSIAGLATETYVTNKIADLVNSAPTTLDTLNELATALGNDPNFATTVATQIGEKVSKTELSNQSYITSTALSNQSYVTTSALSNQSYVTTSALTNQSYVTTSTLSAQSYINQTTLNNASYAGYSYVYAAYSYIINSMVDNEFVVSAALVSQNSRIEQLEIAGYITQNTLSAQSYINQTTLDNASYAGYSYVYAAYSYVLNTIYDNEFVTATVLNYHNDRLEVLENAGYISSSDLYTAIDEIDLSEYAGYSYVYDAYSYVLNTIIDNEYVTAQTFTDLDVRVSNIELLSKIPSYTSADAGKILSVNSSGQLVWITPVSIYTGNGTPDNSQGNDGDIYIQS